MDVFQQDVDVAAPLEEVPVLVDILEYPARVRVTGVTAPLEEAPVEVDILEEPVDVDTTPLEEPAEVDAMNAP